MRIAAAPISWGVSEVPGWGTQLEAERVLADARRLGFRAIEAGPPGFLPDDARAASRLLREHELRLVGAFATAVLHEPARQPAELAALERRARWLRDAGGEVLVLAAATGSLGYERPARGTTSLDAAGWRTLFDSLARAAALAADIGLATALHPHVGTVVERREDVERVLEDSEVGLCLDTGHLTIGATDPVVLARAHARRVRHVHLKDVDATLAAAVREGRLSYTAAVRRGLYRPLGDGDARIGAVLEALERASYDGWLVLEQDVALDDALADPLPAIERSLSFVTSHA